MAVQYLPREDLPEPLLRALSDESYSTSLVEHFSDMDPGLRAQFKHSFSVTTLPRAPRQRVLFARHSHRVYQDPLKNFFSLYGRITHTLLENYASEGDIVEKRLGTLVEIPGYGKVYIHGQGDRYVPPDRKLQDWKVTSSWAMVRGVNKNFEFQLNVLRWLWSLESDHPPIEKLQDVFIFRDWQQRLVRDGTSYPFEPVMVVDVPIWSDEEVLRQVVERATAHLQGEDQSDLELPDCSDEERWVGVPLYKVYKFDEKKGELQKIAKHVSESLPEAEAWAAEHPADAKGKVIKYQIITKKPQPKFCELCQISPFCSQRIAELKLDNQQITDEDV